MVVLLMSYNADPSIFDGEGTHFSVTFNLQLQNQFLDLHAVKKFQKHFIC